MRYLVISWTQDQVSKMLTSINSAFKGETALPGILRKTH